MDDIDRLLTRVKERARGWMPVPVYRRLYESAAACGGGTIVEIGTFRGAATIALALGARSAGAPFRVLTADLLRPGVGLDGRDAQEKAERLFATLAEFGVEDSVRFVHGSAETLAAEADPRDIALLLLDGGGALEADFACLWARLGADAALVIDDIDGSVTVARSAGVATVNQKHRISKLLTERFLEAGMLVEVDRIGSTGWFRKGAASPSPDEIRLLALPAYRELVRAQIASGEFGLARAVARSAAERAPWLRKLYRQFRPGR